jgi:3-oxoacyl-[acyl-carrier-protein] synthase II
LDRVSQLALVAAQEAWLDAGLTWGDATEPNWEHLKGDILPTATKTRCRNAEPGRSNDAEPSRDGSGAGRIAVVVGTALGGMGSLLQNAAKLADAERVAGDAPRLTPFTIPMLMANAPAAAIGIELGAHAGTHAPVSACASGAEAIALALDLLQAGRADIVLAGGAESAINPLAVAGFAAAQALSRRNAEPERASRPWDQARDGFVMAEGAAMLVLETRAHAAARRARVVGTLAGAGITSDAFDVVRPEPSARWQRAAMSDAIARAGLAPSDIASVNAHASSTPQGDAVEAGAIAATFGPHHPVVVGTKSGTGHLLGASGALEAVACLLSLRDRTVPPTLNLDDPDPGLPLDVATAERPLPPGDLAALTNSFGFGGHNVSLVLTNANTSDH